MADINFDAEDCLFSKGAVIKRAEGLKILRRQGKMLIIAPDSMGSAVLNEADQALFAELDKPRDIQDLVGGIGADNHRIAVLTSWYRLGIVQILGKNYAGRYQLCAESLYLRLHLPLPDDVSAWRMPFIVEKTLEYNLKRWSEGSYQTVNLADLWRSLPCLPLTVETTVVHPQMLARLQERLREVFALCQLERLVIHTHLDEGMCAAFNTFFDSGCCKNSDIEVLAYCPAGSPAVYKPRIEELLKMRTACLPVGCLELPQQLPEWIKQMVLQRYRTVGISHRVLLNGEILDKMEQASAVVDNWMKAADAVEEYDRSNSVRLRIHPLERWLVCLGCRGKLQNPKRFEVICNIDNQRALLKNAEDKLPSECMRCFLRGCCAHLEAGKLNSTRCWVRQKLFAELLWRWHERPDSALHNLFCQ